MKQTNDGKQGGLIGGKRHSDGGVQAVVVDANNKPVEIELGEAIIKREAVQKNHKLLSKLNQEAGGNPILPPDSVELSVNTKLSEGKTISEAKTTKDEINKLISGTSRGTAIDTVQATLDYLREGAKTIAMDRASKLFKQKEKELLIEYANKFKINYSSERLSGLISGYINEGCEQKVYLSKNQSLVVKTNDSIFYSSWLDYFESLVLHNYFFKETKYNLVGFTEREGKFCAILSQNFIEATEITKIESIKNFLQKLGFKSTRNENYENEELGLILEDLHSGNVLTNNGILFFIDTVFYVKDKLKDGKTIASELRKGIKEEKEHLDTAKKLYEHKMKPSEAPESIAREHLKENPKYYSEMFDGGGLICHASPTLTNYTHVIEISKENLLRALKHTNGHPKIRVAHNNFIVGNFNVHQKHYIREIDSNDKLRHKEFIHASVATEDAIKAIEERVHDNEELTVYAKKNLLLIPVSKPKKSKYFR